MTHKTAEMDQCIKECIDCASVCLETLAHCLTRGGEHAAAEHITLLQDCAEICRTAADFMLRNSALHTATCRVCAEVCRRCAESCERMAADDQAMARCAEACRRCEASCRDMAGVAA
jgi:hypothetical protein